MVEKLATTPTGSSGSHGAFRKGSGGSILGAAGEVIDQLGAD